MKLRNLRGSSLGKNHSSGPIATDHCQDSAQEIPQGISKFSVVALDESILRKVCIPSSHDVARQIITDCFGSVLICEHEGINNVSHAFAHLRAAQVPPAVNQQLGYLIIRKSDRMQHDEPVNAVRGDENVFPDDL